MCGKRVHLILSVLVLSVALTGTAGAADPVVKGMINCTGHSQGEDYYKMN